MVVSKAQTSIMCVCVRERDEAKTVIKPMDVDTAQIDRSLVCFLSTLLLDLLRPVFARGSTDLLDSCEGVSSVKNFRIEERLVMLVMGFFSETE